MGIQDDIFDVDADIERMMFEERLTSETKTQFDRIVTRLWEQEEELAEAQRKLGVLGEAVDIIQGMAQKPHRVNIQNPLPEVTFRRVGTMEQMPSEPRVMPDMEILTEEIPAPGETRIVKPLPGVTRADSITGR